MIFGQLNYITDPQNRNNRIFVYRNQAPALEVSEKLEKLNIPHKAEPAPNKSGAWKLTIDKKYFDQVFAVNAEVLGRYRQPIIPDSGLRKFLLTIFALALLLAIAGAIFNNAEEPTPDSNVPAETAEKIIALDTGQEPEDTLGAKFREFGFLPVESFDARIVAQPKYATEDNFTGRNLYGPLQTAYIHPDAGKALAKAQELLSAAHPGYAIVVYDAARPRSVQFELYNIMTIMPGVEPLYVSNPHKGSVHNFGLAVDVSLLDENGNPLDMGTPYDYFGIEAHTNQEESLLQNGLLNEKQIQNRRLLRRIMREAGFKTIETEWWHFNLYNREEAFNRGYQLME